MGKDPNAYIQKIIIKSGIHFVSTLTFPAKDVRDPETDEFLSIPDEYSEGLLYFKGKN